MKNIFNKIIKAISKLPLLSVSGKFKKQLNAESETCASKKTWLNWLKDKIIRKFKNKIKYKLRKLNFMTTYKKFVKTFDYSIVIDNKIIGKYKGNYTYGQNKTYYDSFIEVEFIPYPAVLEIPNINISENYYVTLTENVNAESKEQINNLFEKLISQIILNISDYEVNNEENRVLYEIYVTGDEINFVLKLTDENVMAKQRIATILPTQTNIYYPINTDDDYIVSDIYDMLNKKE